jgi:hypothetical protein
LREALLKPGGSARYSLTRDNQQLDTAIRKAAGNADVEQPLARGEGSLNDEDSYNLLIIRLRDPTSNSRRLVGSDIISSHITEILLERRYETPIPLLWQKLKNTFAYGSGELSIGICLLFGGYRHAYVRKAVKDNVFVQQLSRSRSKKIIMSG